MIYEIQQNLTDTSPGDRHYLDIVLKLAFLRSKIPFETKPLSFSPDHDCWLEESPKFLD